MHAITEKYTNVCPVLYAHTDVARLYVYVYTCTRSATLICTPIYIYTTSLIYTFQVPPTNGRYTHILSNITSGY